MAPADELPGKILAYLQRTPLIARAELPLEDKTQSALEKIGHPAARPHRPRLLALQAEHALPADRAPDGHPPDRQAGRLRPLPAGEPAGSGPAVQGAADRGDELLPRPGCVGDAGRQGDPGAARQPVAAARPCAPGCRAARPARRPIPWPSCSGKPSRPPRPRRVSRCRCSPPTWTGMRSTRPGRASFPPTSPRTCRRNGCGGSSCKEEHGYRVRKEIREMVIFAPQNLITRPALHQAGPLELPQSADLSGAGGAEEADAAVPLQPVPRRPLVPRQRGDHRRRSDLFAPLGGKSRLFRRSESGLRPAPVEFPSAFAAGPSAPAAARPAPGPRRSVSSRLADQLILQRLRAAGRAGQ